MLKFFLLSIVFQVSIATTGFDAIQAISTATFECIKNNNYKFFIARVWRSSGTYDPNGMQNIKNANTAGMAHVDGYFFPCTTSKCASAANQVEAAVNKLKSEGATIGMLWMDIERLEWPSDKTSNRKFIQELVTQAEKMGMKVGIYSGYYSWEEIVGLDWTALSKYPLWWPDYNGKQDFTSNWKAYGGWTKPSMHQYHGTETGPCGVSMDLSWYP